MEVCKETGGLGTKINNAAALENESGNGPVGVDARGERALGNPAQQ